LTGFLVDDVKDFTHRTPDGGRLRPAGKFFGHRIQARHTCLPSVAITASPIELSVTASFSSLSRKVTLACCSCLLIAS
jgi:hypothetical protein